MPTKERILVTGANGFIGGWIAETIFLRGIAEVRAGIHTWASAARPARFPMEIVLCDLMKPEQIDEAVSGVSCVIHCAKSGSKESIIKGTQNMLDVSLKRGVKRFVHLSTTEVYGNQTGNIDESFPCQVTGDPYGDSKIEAEKICWEYHEKGLPVVVVRPPIVYGPFSKYWIVDFALKLMSGNWGIYKGLGDGICNLVYIADLVSAILLIARDERAVGEVFNLNGPETPTWNQYFQKFNILLDLPRLKTIEPEATNIATAIREPLRSAAKLVRDRFEGPIKSVAGRFQTANRFMRFMERSMKTKPRSTDFRLFSRKALYVSKKAQDMLGFKPIFGVDAGLEMSVRWMKQVGLLDTGAQNQVLSLV